jgi:hypothetical protein
MIPPVGPKLVGGHAPSVAGGEAQAEAQLADRAKASPVALTPAKNFSKTKGPRESYDIPGMKKQLAATALGKPLPPDALMKFMDRVRKFDAERPTASKVIAVASIITLSATVGYLLNLLVDELAHVTQRKNDKVGMLVGAIVGMLMATSHVSQLFAVPRRLEMKMKARDWWEDGTLPESQARKLIADQFLPLKMALIRNAKANLGQSVKELRIMNVHMVDTLNYIHENGIPKDKWANYMTEYTEAPRFNLPMVRATHSAEHLGITAGKYYVSKFDRADQILERDLQHSYDHAQMRANGLLRDLRRFVAPVSEPPSEQTTELWKQTLLKHAPPSVRAILFTADGHLEQPLAEQLRVFHAMNKEPKAGESKVGTPSAQTVSNTEPLAIPEPPLTAPEERWRDYGRDDNFAENINPQLHTDLVAAFRAKFPKGNVAGRSYIRIDELTKVGLLLSGLRPPTIHTMLRNFMDSFLEGISSGANPSIQARNAGSAFPGYVPMLGIGSVITVLGLGLSSSSPPPAAASESGGKSSNGPASNNSQAALGVGAPAVTYSAPSNVIGSSYMA